MSDDVTQKGRKGAAQIHKGARANHETQMLTITANQDRGKDAEEAKTEDARQKQQHIITQKKR